MANSKPAHCLDHGFSTLSPPFQLGLCDLGRAPSPPPPNSCTPLYLPREEGEITSSFHLRKPRPHHMSKVILLEGPSPTPSRGSQTNRVQKCDLACLVSRCAVCTSCPPPAGGSLCASVSFYPQRFSVWLRNTKVFQALGIAASLGQEEEGWMGSPRCLPSTGKRLITTAVKARQLCEKKMLTEFHQGIPMV